MVSGKERFLLFCRDWLPKLAGNLIVAVFALISLWMFWKCSRGGSSLMIVFNVLMAAASATMASLILVSLYLPSVANGITSFLLFPKRYLRKAPPPLSPIQGMIAAGDFEPAEQRLAELQHQYPDHAETALLRIQLYADELDCPDEAAEAAELYLDSKPDESDPLYFRILMRYADLLQEAGREADLAELLERMLKRGRLTRSRKESLQARLAGLHRQ